MRFVIYISPNGEDMKDGFFVYNDFGQLIDKLSSTDSFYSKLRKTKKDISINFQCLNNEKILNKKQKKFVKNIFCLLKIEKKDLIVLTFPDSLQSLPENLCEKIYIEKLFLPKKLKEIPEDCFVNSEIKEIEFPETLEIIGEYAFANNKEITELNFEKCKNLKQIRSNAFFKCQKLERVNLSICTGVEIESFAFNDCKIRTLNLPEGSILNENCLNFWYIENLRLPFTINNMETSVSVRDVFQSFEIDGKVICFGKYEKDSFNFKNTLPLHLLKTRKNEDYNVCYEIYIEDCEFNKISNQKDFLYLNMIAFKQTAFKQTIFEIEPFEKLYHQQKMLIPKRMLSSIFEEILLSSKQGTVFNINYKVERRNFTLKILDINSYSVFLESLERKNLKHKCIREDEIFLIAHNSTDEKLEDYFATYYKKINFFKKKKIKKNTEEGKIDEIVVSTIFENKENNISFEKIENYIPKNLIKEETKEELIIPLVEKIDKINNEISDEYMISKELYELSKQVKEAYKFFDNNFDKNKSLKNKLENFLPEIIKTIESFVEFSKLPGCQNEIQATQETLNLLILNTINSIKIEVENEKMWRQLNLEAQAKALSSIINNNSFKDELLKSKYDISFIEILQDMGYKITDQNATCIILKGKDPVYHLIYLNLNDKLSIDIVINNTLLNASNIQFYKNSYPEIFKKANEIMKIVSKFKLK